MYRRFRDVVPCSLSGTHWSQLTSRERRSRTGSTPPDFSGPPDPQVRGSTSTSRRRVRPAHAGKLLNQAPGFPSAGLHEAYTICSVAGDLEINETVDLPNWLVSMTLLRGIFA